MIAGDENVPVIVAVTRTPIGKFGGVLKSVRSDDLAAAVISDIVRRTGIDSSLIDDVYFGCTNQSGEDSRNVARMALLLAGLPCEIAGATVNRLCGSGLEAINQAARAIRSGEEEVTIAGGVESMTRAPYVGPKPAKAFPRGEIKLADSTIGWRFVNPSWPSQYPPISMGETAENVAEKYSIPRTQQDEFAYNSHMKAIRAVEEKKFDAEIVPIRTAEQPAGVTRDETPRKDTSLEKLSTLPPVFRANGTVTAGNSSGINDGAAALLITSVRRAESLGLKPLAKILGSAVSGVHPSFMGIGPVPATKKLISRLRMNLSEFEVVELNEAFASQVLACLSELPEIDPMKVNPNGGAIALGHPLGCSGARIVVSLMSEMQRRRLRYGLATMCIGVGQGISTAFEIC